jgi:hypothetical protein
MTFGLIVPPGHRLGPPVGELDPRAHQAAELVASRKMKAGNWKTLHRYFELEPAR